MTALGLLSSNYGCSSDEDEGDNEDCTIKRSGGIESEGNEAKLSVPTAIKSMFNDSEIAEDNFAHEGRTRTIPHVRGNWASYVYVPLYLEESILDKFDIFISNMNNILKFKKNHLQGFENHHISLSQTVLLQHHWIELITNSLKSSISDNSCFYLSLRNLEVYQNEEKTRTFIGVKVDHGFSKLKEFVGIINGAFREFKLPSFFEKPSFHVSLAWCLGDNQNLFTELPKIQEMYQNLRLKQSFHIEKLEFKTGNKLFVINLR